MDPVSLASDGIDRVEEFLGHSPHPAIIGLPIGAWAVSNVCDVMGMFGGGQPCDDAARLSMGIGLVGAAGAVVTGLRDYSFIPKDRQPNHDIATRHALGNAVAGSLFAASYVMRALDYQAGRRPSLASRLLGLAGGSLVLYTAWLGGKLVEELGEAVKPVMEQQEQKEEEEQQQVTGHHHDGDHRQAERAGGTPVGRG
jgi:uncharacterized membrane protein